MVLLLNQILHALVVKVPFTVILYVCRQTEHISYNCSRPLQYEWLRNLMPQLRRLGRRTLHHQQNLPQLYTKKIIIITKVFSLRL
jgi:hypothetical protein